MKRNSIARKIDLLFLSVTLYLLLYIVYYTLYRKTVFSLTLAFMTLTIIHLLYWGLTKGRRERQALEKREQSRREEIFYSLPFLNTQAQTDFFEELFARAGYTASRFEGFLIAEKGEKRRNVYARFDGPAEQKDVFSAEHVRQRADCAGFILLCPALEEEARQALKALSGGDNIVLQKADIYALMKKYATFPEIICQKPHDKRRLREIFSYMFKRERFKSFFFLALIMFLFSFVSPFKMYYLIFSGVLYLFCLFTLLFGRKKDNVKSELDKV